MGDEPPQLLPGRSALQWVRVEAVCYAGAFILFGLSLLALAVLPMPSRTIVAWTGTGFACAFATGIIVGSISEGRATLREMAAGYTTVYDRHFELWQLAPRTGAVVRRPGERDYPKKAKPRPS